MFIFQVKSIQTFEKAKQLVPSVRTFRYMLKLMVENSENPFISSNPVCSWKKEIIFQFFLTLCIKHRA